MLRIVAPFGFLAACGGAAASVNPGTAVVVPQAARDAAAPKPRGTRGGALAAGYAHTCALLDGPASTGAVACWGEGKLGELGRVVAGADDAGTARVVDLGTGQTAVAVSAGASHTCALLRTGAVKCWGKGDSGQLGLGDAKNRGNGPNDMGDALPAVDLGTGRRAVALSAGAFHTCVLLDTGAVRCWGQGADGQLGLGDPKNRGDGPNEMGDALPPVDLGTGRTAIAVSAGGLHTCAVLDTGAVKCWGKGLFGRLGLGDAKSRGSAPTEMGDALPAVDLGAGQTAIAVSAGGFHTCALLRGGAVKCWGEEDTGRLGLGARKSRGTGPTEMGDALPAVDLGTGQTAIAVSAGALHTCALLATGAVKCWGEGKFGRLGLGDEKSRGTGPTEMGDALPAVALGTEQTAIAVSAGGYHTCVLLDGARPFATASEFAGSGVARDGGPTSTGARVACWGRGAEGQLGVGDTPTRGTRPNEMGEALPAVDLGGLVAR